MSVAALGNSSRQHFTQIGSSTNISSTCAKVAGFFFPDVYDLLISCNILMFTSNYVTLP
jgi:hypothetical protein